MENTNDTKRMIMIGIAGLIVGFGAGWLWFGGSAKTEEEEDVDLPMATTTALLLEEEKGETKESTSGEQKMIQAVENKMVGAAEYKTFVTTQAAGNEVVIAQLGLKEKAWVVIHEDSRGRPANILGARRFDAGEHIAASVKLLRNTLAGGVYYVMIHADNGDATFEPLKEVALTSESGSPLMERFTTTP
jgi:hypothetical protein